MASLSGFLKKTYARDISNLQNISPFESQYSRNVEKSRFGNERIEISPMEISNKKNLTQKSEVRESARNERIELSPIKRTPSLGKMFNQLGSNLKKISALKELEQSANPHKMANCIISEKKLRPIFVKKFSGYDKETQKKIIQHLKKLMKKSNLVKFKEMNFTHFENLIENDEENEALIETERRTSGGRIASLERENENGKNSNEGINKFTTIKESELI